MAALPNSVLVPLNELPQRAAELKPPPGALVVTYCHHGVRSLTAAEFLEHCGFQDVHSSPAASTPGRGRSIVGATVFTAEFPMSLRTNFN